MTRSHKLGILMEYYNVLVIYYSHFISLMMRDYCMSVLILCFPEI